jgi:hypothetical protein
MNRERAEGLLVFEVAYPHCCMLFLLRRIIVRYHNINA